MSRRSAINRDLLASDHQRNKLDTLGDLLQAIEAHINFRALTIEIDRVAPRPKNHPKWKASVS